MNNITIENIESVAILRVDRPKALNALSNEVLDELKEAFLNLKVDDEAKVVVFTGAGEKAFIAGADIAEMESMSAVEAMEYAEKGQAVTKLIENFPKPVIAAINGFALGGGCEFAMACHFRYASDRAKLGQPEINLGLIPGFGGTQRLARLIGKGQAMEWLLTGKTITAEEAHAFGLLNSVFPAEELMEATLKTAKQIARKSSVMLEKIIYTTNNGLDMPLTEGLNLEAEEFGKVFETDDHSEGIRAFLEKRRANFSGK